MKKNFLFLLFSLLVFSSLAGPVLAETVALPNPLCRADRPPGATCIATLPELIAHIARYITTVIGAIAALMFVISGIMFVISAGNPEKTKRARDIAMYAAIGAIIAFAGRGLVELVKAVIGAT